MFQANAMGFFGLVSVLMCWIFAGLLCRVSVSGSVARKLAMLLVFEGLTLLTSGYIGLLFSPEAISSDWFSTYYESESIVHRFGDCVLIALYPPFLAASLRTSLTRPFAMRRVRIGLGIASGVLFVAVNLSSDAVGLVLLYAAMSILFSYALVVAIHAWIVAAPGIDRTRARAFALAFGFRDICWVSIYVHGIILILTGQLDAPEPDSMFIVYASGTFFAVPLIAYGILRTQLFDIDLRIRWTIKQSTVAAVFVAIFYLVSEGADRFLASEFGNIAGLVASAMVVFFLVPLQRFAERVASAAMPSTENTPEYAMFRKLQVYEAALAEALPDGSISERERALLNTLRDSLGIAVSDADAIERELQQSLA